MLRYSDPTPVLRRFFYSCQDALHPQAISEVGVKLTPLIQRLKKIREGCDERMFVPDDVSRWPELLCVGVLWAGHKNVAHARHFVGIADVEELQTIQIFQVEA